MDHNYAEILKIAVKMTKNNPGRKKERDSKGGQRKLEEPTP